jgi:DNA-binding PadR family transcriptional regulator
MYEFIILQRLSHLPMHGYLIAKIINDIIGPFTKVSNGRLYPLMAKMEADGLIATVEEAKGSADRRQRWFKITEAGHKRFHQLMLDTTSNPGDYNRIFWLKVASFEEVTPSERLYLVDHYLNYCQTLVFHLRHEMEELAEECARNHFMTEVQLDATLYTMRHALSMWQFEIESARALRERVMAQAEGMPVERVDARPQGQEG